MAHVGLAKLKTKPGSYQKVCDRYHTFATEVMARNKDLHDVIIVGNQAENIIHGFGIWENAAHAASLEDGIDFAKLMSDIGDDLAEPFGREDLVLLYRMNTKA